MLISNEYSPGCSPRDRAITSKSNTLSDNKCVSYYATFTKNYAHQKRQLELKKMLLSQKPTDYGIDRYIWTGEIISTVLKQKWGVELKDSRIYEILDSLNLSHHQAHRDYANADKELQLQFVETLKKNYSPSRKRKR